MAIKDNFTPTSLGVTDDECVLFTKIDTLFGENSEQFFQQVLDERVRLTCEGDPTLNGKNIATKLMSPYYFASVKNPLPIGNNDWHQIEQQALFIFDNWGQAWCSYKIWKLKKQYSSPLGLALDPHAASRTRCEEDYFDSVIDNIESHQELYYTMHCKQPMLLPDAIVLINLATFVLQHHWYEMLYEIDISRFGTHFILACQTTESSPPLIVASAKINHHAHADQWLYFSPFFQTDAWQLLPTNKVIDQLTQHNLLKGPVVGGCSTQFENSLWQQITRPEECCEIVRLTVSGNQTEMIFFLYLAQKRLMEQLVALRYQIAFVVIEQPLMIQYYLSQGEAVYTRLSASHVSDSEFATYKGLWFIEPLNQALAQSSFKHYKQRTISQLKQYRNHGHKPHYA
ncbi:acyl-homoserine-lactone synthase [Vibrio brasiliensis]|uniref:acyl-homoserine-lactone synthase n=1 Tax=Vibrio brasiliensis TaxID=170652 RepID=UPI001EFD2E06|nr:acyl-homoserine-lactone synthase [Vibrio brasiliensis]MCG9724583.1 acyl-homoserine-lactone synthase [Vibrio brasiliensis]